MPVYCANPWAAVPSTIGILFTNSGTVYRPHTNTLTFQQQPGRLQAVRSPPRPPGCNHQFSRMAALFGGFVHTAEPAGSLWSSFEKGTLRADLLLIRSPSRDNRFPAAGRAFVGWTGGTPHAGVGRALIPNLQLLGGTFLSQPSIPEAEQSLTLTLAGPTLKRQLLQTVSGNAQLGNGGTLNRKPGRLWDGATVNWSAGTATGPINTSPPTVC